MTYYVGFGIVYIALSVLFIADVLRQPANVLSGAGKALWVVALLLVPVFAWLIYGTWRLRRSRGL